LLTLRTLSGARPILRLVDPSPATLVVSAGRPIPEPGAPLNVPLVLSSTFHAGGEIGYGRDGNPTWTAFEDALGSLDGGRGLAFASGIGAVAAVLDAVPEGGVVVAPSLAYSGTVALLQQYEGSGRLEVRRYDASDPAAALLLLPGSDLVWVESATNPMLDVADIPAIAAAAHTVGASVVVDATFVTPLVQRPLDLGGDVVVHSATKFLSGHSDVLLGAVVTRDEGWYARLARLRHDRGAIPGPFEVWLALRGLRTLAVRLDRSQANALELAQRLVAHPAVQRVRHPGLPEHAGHATASRDWRGFGSLVSIEVGGDAETAERVAESTRLWVHATSLGGLESTLERRRRWAAEPEGVPETLIRLSVGIEDVEDLWADLDAALRS
jgi:cystathionine gamma-synthase